MKKIIATLSAAAIAAAALFSMSACGSAEVLFTISEDGTHYVVSGVSGNKTALDSYVIPASYDDGENGVLPVTEIGERAFMYCSLYSVSIPETVVKINDLAFAYTKLNSVDIPYSVTSIGYSAFAWCTGLKEVEIPSSVTTLDDNAFIYCSSLEEVVVNASITVLNKGVFSGHVLQDSSGNYIDTVLTKITLPAGIEAMYSDSIYYNPLTDIYFGGTSQQWKNIKILENVQNDDGETEVEELDAIEYFSLFSGLTVHCTDADLTYSNGQINSTPVT